MMGTSEGRRVASVMAVGLVCLSALDGLSFPGLTDTKIQKEDPIQQNATLSIDKILFVNIRKSGGVEIKYSFQPSSQDEDAPVLSSKVIARLHTKPETLPKGGTELADAYLYNLRHPIDRMLAWYLDEHPKSCVSKTTTRRACLTANEADRHSKGDAALFYRKCFPTPKQLSHAFTNKTSKRCNKLAQSVIDDKIHGSGFRETPFHCDIHYYTNKTINQYPNKTVLVLRSERIFEDLNDLEALLGGTRRFKVKKTYHDQAPKDALTRNYGPLCWAMREELQEYRRLLDLAVNLNATEKKATLARANGICGFSSSRAE